jgi:hypothetical protein
MTEESLERAGKWLLLLALAVQVAAMVSLGLDAKTAALVLFLVGLFVAAVGVVGFFLGKLLRIHNVKLP